MVSLTQATYSPKYLCCDKSDVGILDVNSITWKLVSYLCMQTNRCYTLLPFVALMAAVCEFLLMFFLDYHDCSPAEAEVVVFGESSNVPGFHPVLSIFALLKYIHSHAALNCV